MPELATETSSGQPAAAAAGTPSQPSAQPAAGIQTELSLGQQAKPETPPAAAPVADIQAMEDKMRRYQSDRDKAESTLRKFVEQALPYVDIDEGMNITGYRQPAQQQKSQEEVMASLVDAANAGDKNALYQLTMLSKETAKREAFDEFRRYTDYTNAMSTTENKIKQDFPYLVKQDGSYDTENVVFKEAQKILAANKSLNAYDPNQLRVVMELAESRVFKQNFPEIEGKIRTEAQNMLNKTASASAATPSVAQQMQEPQSEITPELKERLMREGYNPEDFSRINNIIKQAKERNGFYL
jgi:hypothetical protein